MDRDELLKILNEIYKTKKAESYANGTVTSVIFGIFFLVAFAGGFIYFITYNKKKK